MGTKGQWCPLLKWGLILNIFVALLLTWLEIVLGFRLAHDFLELIKSTALCPAF